MPTHLAQKFKGEFLTQARRDGWEIHFVYEVFCSLTLFSERKWRLQAR